MRYAKDIMKTKVDVVKADDSIQTACKVLIKNKISGMPVVGKNYKLIGFISEKDIIKLLSRSPGYRGMKVSKIMIKKPIAVDEKATLDLISKIFSEKPYRRLPVTSMGKVVGIINRADIMDKLLSEHY